MKLATITTLYPRYLRDFEQRHPEVAGLDYKAHQALLHDDAFGECNHIERNLHDLGHDTLRIEANYPGLQDKWACENLAGGARGPLHIVREQIRSFAPDVLLVEDCFEFTPAILANLINGIAGIRALVCHVGIECDAARMVPPGAIVLAPTSHLARNWAAQGLDAVLFRHAFEPRILSTLGVLEAPRGITFIGSSSPFVHPMRHEWLGEMAKELPSLEIFTDSFDVPPLALLRTTLSSLSRRRFRRIYDHFSSPVRRKARKAVYGIPMYKTLAESLVTLNCHINLSEPTAGNMRLFESTGVGTCLLTDARSDMRDVFEPDSEVVTYSSNQECVEKAKWLLSNPGRAAEIGMCGKRRTLKDHTYAQRARQLEFLVLDRLKRL